MSEIKDGMGLNLAIAMIRMNMEDMQNKLNDILDFVNKNVKSPVVILDDKQTKGAAPSAIVMPVIACDDPESAYKNASAYVNYAKMDESAIERVTDTDTEKISASKGNKMAVAQ